MKRLLSLSLTTALMAAALSAFALPTAVIKVVGVSDRDVAKDTSDIYTRPSTGLASAGVGEMVYIAGNPADTAITAWSWELAIPNGSSAELNDTEDPVVFFIPDRAGKFLVTLTVTSADGQSDPLTMAINSANYVGVGGITGEAEVPQCAACHSGDPESDKVTPWSGTKHARMFTDGINGVKSPSYKASCIKCHTVGYDTDPGAVNNGFDDVAAAEGWVFPDTPLVADNWDQMIQNFPNTADKANIQCENCHGPGSRHSSAITDNKMVVDYDNDACAKCHDSGSHHTRPYQWDYSGHAKVTTRPSGPGEEACVRCHTGYGFIDYVDGVPDSLKRTDYLPIVCVACHDPHDATNEYQLRKVDAYTLENGVEVDYGAANLCLNCHHSRRNGEEYAAQYHSRFSPHYGVQGDMFTGTNAIEYGQEIESSPHNVAVEGACTGCHMAPGPENAADPGYLQLGDHSFAVKTADGVENIAVCQACHEGAESFESIMPEEDWDGDGAIEGVMAELDGMAEELAMLLPPVGEPEVVVTEAYTSAQLKAAYNYLFYEEDGSHGVHNADYAHGILAASLGDDLGVERLETAAPYEWSLGNAYPNPFNPMATFNYSLAKDASVSIRIYDLTGRLVQDLFSGNQPAGAYKRAVNFAGQPAGLYLLSLSAGGFEASTKLVLMK
jgi:nitrate reductase cytochrome c-type subunit